jgi:hypothetical protein
LLALTEVPERAAEGVVRNAGINPAFDPARFSMPASRSNDGSGQ